MAKGGARPGAGRPKGTTKEIIKDKTFLGIKVTEEEKAILVEKFENFKKKYNLNSTEAIRKMVMELD